MSTQDFILDHKIQDQKLAQQQRIHLLDYYCQIIQPQQQNFVRFCGKSCFSFKIFKLWFQDAAKLSKYHSSASFIQELVNFSFLNALNSE